MKMRKNLLITGICFIILSSSCGNDESKRCSMCGAYSEGLYTTDDGESYCGNCLSKFDYKCANCGKFYNKDDSLSNLYCQTCFDNNSEECLMCGEYRLKSEMINTSYGDICMSCMNDIFSFNPNLSNSFKNYIDTKYEVDVQKLIESE